MTQHGDGTQWKTIDGEEEKRVRERWLGRVIGNCEVKSFVGSGATGVVFRGKHTLLGKAVAVKVLPRHAAAAGSGNIERLLKEARAASSLEHPGLVQVYDIDVTDDGDYYVVMQFVDGMDLERIVGERGSLPYDLIINICLQAVGALAYLHERGFIHRDLKPSNILISKEGRVKLVDLGLVKSFGDPTRSDAGMIMGTPNYMSPEQAKGPAHTIPASDIYSLGATIYYMLTAKPPFEGETTADVIIKHATEPTPPLRRFRPDIPRPLERTIERMLEKEPVSRPGLDEITAALKRLENEEYSIQWLFLEASLEEDHLAASLFLVEHGAETGYLGFSEVEQALHIQGELFAHGVRSSLAKIMIDEGFLGEATLEAFAAEYARLRPRQEEAALTALAETGKFDVNLLGRMYSPAAAIDTGPLEILLSDGALSSADYKKYQRLVRNRMLRNLRASLLTFLPIGEKERGELLARLEKADTAQDVSVLTLAVSEGLVAEETAWTAVGLLLRRAAREHVSGNVGTSLAQIEEAAAGAAGEALNLAELSLEGSPACPVCGADLDSKGRCPDCSRRPVKESAESAEEAVLLVASVVEDDEPDGAEAIFTAAVVDDDPSKPLSAEGMDGVVSRSVPDDSPLPYPRRERSGDGAWGILTGDDEDKNGYALEDMARLIEAGYLTRNTTVKGPTTGGNWVFARSAPALSRFLGTCPHCEAEVSEGDAECPRCRRLIDMPGQLAEKPSRNRIDTLRDWLGL